MNDTEAERLAMENRKLAEKARDDAERMNMNDQPGEANAQKQDQPAKSTDTGEQG